MHSLREQGSAIIQFQNFWIFQLGNPFENATRFHTRCSGQYLMAFQTRTGKHSPKGMAKICPQKAPWKKNGIIEDQGLNYNNIAKKNNCHLKRSTSDFNGPIFARNHRSAVSHTHSLSPFPFNFMDLHYIY